MSRRRRHRRGRRRRRRRFLTPRKPNNLERLAMCARWQTSTMNVNHIITRLITRFLTPRGPINLEQPSTLQGDRATENAAWARQP